MNADPKKRNALNNMIDIARTTWAQRSLFWEVYAPAYVRRYLVSRTADGEICRKRFATFAFFPLPSMAFNPLGYQYF